MRRAGGGVQRDRGVGRGRAAGWAGLVLVRGSWGVGGVGSGMSIWGVNVGFGAWGLGSGAWAVCREVRWALAVGLEHWCVVCGAWWSVIRVVKGTGLECGGVRMWTARAAGAARAARA